MFKKSVSIVLAALMLSSLYGCVKDDTDTKTPSSGSLDNEIHFEAVTDPTPYDTISPILTKLGTDGIEYNLQVDEAPSTSDYFIHEVTTEYTLTVGDEQIYILDFGSEEYAQEHAECYSEDASGYGYVIIDYIAPVHFWRDGSVIIEYASERGDLLPLLNELYGEEFAGAGNYGYRPEFTDKLSEVLEESEIYPTYSFITETDTYISVTAWITTYDYLTLYKYNDSKDFSAHSSSPIEAPVLDLPSLWSDPSSLVVIEYFGMNEDVISALDNNFSINAKAIAVNNINFVETNIQAKSADFVTVISSLDELEAYRQENCDTYGFMLDPTCPVGEDMTKWDFVRDTYTENWFEYNSLIIVRSCEACSSVTYDIEMLTRSLDTLTLNLTRTASDGNDWILTTHFIFIGASKSDTNGCDITLNISPTRENIRLTEYDPTPIRTDAYEELEDSIVVITSFAELEQYYEDNKELYDLEHRETVYSDTTIGFVDIFDTYTQEWFQDRVLIMVIKNEPSGSISHGIFNITKSPKSGEICVTIGRAVPNMCTDDLACWHILVGIPRESYQETNSVNAAFVNIDPPTE